jgi:hypothetical protein
MGVKFSTKINTIFPPVNSADVDVLLQRPDYYLGRFLAMFGEKVSRTYFGVNDTIRDHLKSPFQKQILKLISFYFNQEKLEGFIIQKIPWCWYSANSILSNLIYTFLDISKHSMAGTTAKTEAQLIDFEQNYINGSIFLGTQTVERPRYLYKMPEIIPFCNLAPKFQLHNMPKDQLSQCDDFNLMVTPKGLCYSFNSLTINDLYKESNLSDNWISVFEQQKHKKLIYPAGYGPSTGLNFVLNSFEHYFRSKHPFHSNVFRFSQNFLLSITNEFNPYEVFKQNFYIEPGNIYTYRIVANQVITTERFESMDNVIRNCSLPRENTNNQFTKSYSKSACEYECAIDYAKKECSMNPWYIPRFSNEKLKFFGGYSDTICFDEAISKFSTLQCNCPSDCSGTSFSVFESRIPIVNFYCNNTQTKIKEYPYSVLCNLCNEIWKTHYLGFLHNYIVLDGPDPSKYEAFCNTLLSEHVSVVKIEMATKSLTRSLKDKRFNFVSQLSSLGNAYNFLYILNVFFSCRIFD